MARLHNLLLPLLLWSASADAREVVDAASPQDLAVTVYRDPNRNAGQAMNRDWPQGFAMISETRTVTLPQGESTIRFSGVAEGMVAVSAIVTGLPGGTIEKNRNADLLSPAALVDGTLGNRVRITRTNPGTGATVSESAVIRTRADGGLVLQTGDGYEAVRCSGIAESLSFDAVPDGLSAEPVFTIDTADEVGGTYTVTLTYLAWGFDWQANYVATLHEGGRNQDVRMRLMSWLTILNDNGQSFENAELMTVAGTLNVVSDFQSLADAPEGRPLRLTCYPLGSTATGSPFPNLNPPSSPMPAPMMRAGMAEMAMADEAAIMVTGSRIQAQEEDLGDLKLYRVPETMTVNAQGLKQVAFLDRDEVEGRFVYRSSCFPENRSSTPEDTAIFFVTQNDEEHGLGVALPFGSISFFEPAQHGQLFVGEETFRDHAVGQDVEVPISRSAQVMGQCFIQDNRDPADFPDTWTRKRIVLTNANPSAAEVEVSLAPTTSNYSGLWDVRGDGVTVKDGMRIVTLTVPANGSVEYQWQVRPGDDD